MLLRRENILSAYMLAAGILWSLIGAVILSYAIGNISTAVFVVGAFIYLVVAIAVSWVLWAKLINPLLEY